MADFVLVGQFDDLKGKVVRLHYPDRVPDSDSQEAMLLQELNSKRASFKGK